MVVTLEGCGVGGGSLFVLHVAHLLWLLHSLAEPWGHPLHQLCIHFYTVIPQGARIVHRTVVVYKIKKYITPSTWAATCYRWQVGL